MMNQRILIADDSAFMRMMLKKILIKHGYDVIGEAENGIEAVASYILLKPDLVVMDINMPEMSGTEALNKMMTIDSNAKVVIVSSAIGNDSVQQALQSGALDFVVKPFSKNRLIQAIEKAASGTCVHVHLDSDSFIKDK